MRLPWHCRLYNVLSGILLSLASCLGPVPAAQCDDEVHFERLTLSEEFQSEGADAGDLDGDGDLDVVAGPYWYEGPDFRRRHAYTSATRHAIAGYSDHFFNWCEDVDGDANLDIVTVGMPGDPGYWYRNPGANAKGHWEKFVLLNEVGGESPELADFDGDGVRDLVCVHQGNFGYATRSKKSRPSQARQPWTFHPVSTGGGLGRFTHGMGLGPIRSGGSLALLETRGWWERVDDGFQLRPVRFAESGGSQMYAYDFDGDGDNDVVSVQNAHGWGLTWFEHQRAGAETRFVPHRILTQNPADHPAGLAISQMHALALADIDGDGVKDLVTGKRYWAHGGRDPGAQELPVLYWLRTVRQGGRVRFEPHLIDERVGVGTQLVVKDVNGDERPDVLVGNKLGAYVLLQTGAPQDSPEAPNRTAEWSQLRQVGTDLFRTHIRETPPLTAAEQARGFVAPPGFRVELVAAEPEINKPLNLAFDDRGRLWVASTVEYPVPQPVGSKGRDSIKVLTDTDGDGAYDQTATFAEGLNIPMGLYPVDNGVICFDIPNIVRLDDTDGDGVADRRTKLLGPFDTTRDTHGMCNAFTRGYDGWLYACHGFNNRSKVAGTDGDAIEMRSGNTFRMRLDGSRVEHFGHGQVNPFGLAIDSYGDVLTADCHTKPINLVLRGGYHDSFGAPHDGLGYVPDVLDHLHGSTGIGGIVLGESLRFPQIYRDSTFGGNVVTGRVNRNTLLRREKLTAQEEPDFVVCSDPWFRPVDLQAGPDGALYIADFYNRIIGHYEVKIDHPGRDRRRGRIWRVRYVGDEGRRDDAPKPQAPATNFARMASSQLWQALSSTSPENRMRIINLLLDRNAEEAVGLARQRTLAELEAPQRVAALWILARSDALEQADLVAAFDSSSDVARTHAFRVLEEFGSALDAIQLTPKMLAKGLRDESPEVRRAAALAAATQPNPHFIDPLLQSLRGNAPPNSHVRHATRMSLRNQLKDEAAFERLAARGEERDRDTLIGLALALKTAAAGDYVARHFGALQITDAARLKELAQFAARYAAPESATELAAGIQERLRDDIPAQLELLRSVDNGARQRGARPAAVRQWALRLARRLAELSAQAERSLGWTFHPAPVNLQEKQCWTLSKRRSCSDGMQNALLYSSFPLGEQRTGIYRSDEFKLDAELSFYLAGHDGEPGKPIQNKNYVQLRSAADHQVLQRTAPPRNDTAQWVRWDTSEYRGMRAYLELVDTDTGNAFAWLAVGRFSDERLNPTEESSYRREAAKLVRDFGLQELSSAMAAQLRRWPRETEAAAALASLRGGAACQALADSLGSPLVEKLRKSVIDQLVNGSEASALQQVELFQAALKSASAPQQRAMAISLSRDAGGRRLLLTLVEQGSMNARWLQDAAVAPRFAAATEMQRESRSRLLAGLPSEAPEVAASIRRRTQRYRSRPGNALAGKPVFKERCAVCHQVAGQGKKVGPNLDGIGTRGLARLMEDVLAPNRNVDAAFRATMIATEDGQVVTGALRPDDGGELLVVVNEKGEEVRIPKSEVARQKRSPLSPMPANMATAINDDDFMALMAYLLSLR